MIGMVPTIGIVTFFISIMVVLVRALSKNNRLDTAALGIVCVVSIVYVIGVAYFPISAIFFPPDKIDPAGYWVGMLLSPTLISLFGGILATGFALAAKVLLHIMGQLMVKNCEITNDPS